jgi:hypothetical protein
MCCFLQSQGHRSLEIAEEGDIPFLDLPPLGRKASKEFSPFPFPPRGKAGAGGSPHAARNGRLPLQEGFQSALLKTPLLSPEMPHELNTGAKFACYPPFVRKPEKQKAGYLAFVNSGYIV